MQESHAASADEVELKAVVPDLAAARARVEAAGGTLLFEGELIDRRWDTPTRALRARDEVLRTRAAIPAPDAPGSPHASLDVKGPTRRIDGYKVREERSTAVVDVGVVALALERAGLVVSREIDRRIAQYALHGAVVRFEEYPAMDVLVEVEGAPDAIERAIAVLAIPRAAFGTGSLGDYQAAYEARTGRRAAVCRREAAGEFPFRREDA